MTASEELSLLETAYSSWIAGGCPQAYSLNGRSITKVDAKWWSTRIDALRLQVARQTSGMFAASQFRNPE